MVDQILSQCLKGKRISNSEVLHLIISTNWTSIAAAAHARRNQLHNTNEASYTVFQIINYTNVCDIECAFCSFHTNADNTNAYTLSIEQISHKAKLAQNQGTNQIFFQGGVNTSLGLSYFQDAFTLLKEMNMEIRALSPVEIWHLAKREGISVEAAIGKLKNYGMSSVPGAGAELLTGNMRQVLSPRKLSARNWCKVMGEAHKQGLPGSANIVFGSSETPEDIAAHLAVIRDQQDKSGGFLSFIPWVFQPQTEKFPQRHVKTWEYLKILAICRLFFDNIKNIEASVLVFGRDIAELALYCGANDISSVVLEENVLDSKGFSSEKYARDFLTNAGFEPVKRDMNYNITG